MPVGARARQHNLPRASDYDAAVRPRHQVVVASGAVLDARGSHRGRYGWHSLFPGLMSCGGRSRRDDMAAGSADGHDVIGIVRQQVASVAVGRQDDCLGSGWPARCLQRPVAVSVARRRYGLYGRVGLQVDTLRDGHTQKVHDKLVWPRLVSRCWCCWL